LVAEVSKAPAIFLQWQSKKTGAQTNRGCTQLCA